MDYLIFYLYVKKKYNQNLSLGMVPIQPKSHDFFVRSAPISSLAHQGFTKFFNLG